LPHTAIVQPGKCAKLNPEMSYATKPISLPIHTCMHGVKKATKFEMYA